MRTTRFTLIACLMAGALTLSACGGSGNDRFDNGPEPSPGGGDITAMPLVNPPMVTSTPQSADPAQTPGNAQELWTGQPLYIGFTPQTEAQLPANIQGESPACPAGLHETANSHPRKRIFTCTPSVAGQQDFTFHIAGKPHRLLGLTLKIKDPHEQSAIQRLTITPQPVLLGQKLTVNIEGAFLRHAKNPRLTLPGCDLQESQPATDALRSFSCHPTQAGRLRLHVWLTPHLPNSEYDFSKSQNDNVDVQDPGSWIPQMQAMHVAPETPRKGEPFHVNVEGLYLDQGVRLEMAGCAFTQVSLSPTAARWSCTPAAAHKGAVITLYDSKTSKALGSRVVDVVESAAVPQGRITLNDTGSGVCHHGGQASAGACDDTARQWNGGQDGLQGRDVTHPHDADGRKGFQFAQVGGYPLTDCVHDQVTGLVWQGMNAGNSAVIAFQQIPERVAQANAQRLCGRGDWRVPSAQELASLVDLGSPSADPKAAAVDARWLPNTPAGRYFSNSLTNSEYRYAVLSVDFAPSYVKYSPDYIFSAGGSRHNLVWSSYQTRRNSRFYLRLVAGAHPVGSVFDMEADAAAPRYLVLADRSLVRDRVSNLVWQRCVIGTQYQDTANGKGRCVGKASWLEHEDAMAEAHKQAVGGWRMPNIKELMSLHGNPGASRASHAFPFPDTDRDFNAITGEWNPAAVGSRAFWSSTANAWSAGQAWVYRFDHQTHAAWALPRKGANADDYKLNTRLVRDARAGD